MECCIERRHGRGAGGERPADALDSGREQHVGRRRMDRAARVQMNVRVARIPAARRHVDPPEHGHRKLNRRRRIQGYRLRYGLDAAADAQPRTSRRQLHVEGAIGVEIGLVLLRLADRRAGPCG